MVLVASNRVLCATVDQLNAFAATCDSKLLVLYHKVCGGSAPGYKQVIGQEF
jgi:hypothetical protein